MQRSSLKAFLYRDNLKLVLMVWDKLEHPWITQNHSFRICCLKTILFLFITYIVSSKNLNILFYVIRLEIIVNLPKIRRIQQFRVVHYFAARLGNCEVECRLMLSGNLKTLPICKEIFRWMYWVCFSCQCSIFSWIIFMKMSRFEFLPPEFSTAERTNRLADSSESPKCINLSKNHIPKKIIKFSDLMQQ